MTPNKIVATREEIDLGGRVVSLQAHKPAHTNSDLSMFDRASGLFLPADLLLSGACPRLTAA